MLHGVVMAGGAGTRFWPRSRADRPKQLLSLVTEKALLVETVHRLGGLIDGPQIHVITNASYADRIREMLPEVPKGQVVAEPCGRDTAPCIGLAASLIHRQDPDGVMAILPADHVVEPETAFREALGAANSVIEASPSTLLTFGVAPNRPATGYGYIERGEVRGEVGGTPWYGVNSFREKPDLETAGKMIEAGNFLWNAGIFVFRASAILERLQRFLPELSKMLPSVADELLKTGEIEEATFAALPRISIDYGVLEKDDDVGVMEAPFQWDDVGSFAALTRVLETDSEGNCVLGSATILESEGNVIIADEDHHIAIMGARDLVVVHSSDATLVCRKEDAERVKDIVSKLTDGGHHHLL